MDFENFIKSVQEQNKPKNLSLQLEAMWYDAIGDWQKAHDLVDGPSDQLSAKVHAYLHRKEGDLWNADYWYRKSGETRPSCSLKQEWELLVRAMLEKE